MVDETTNAVPSAYERLREAVVKEDGARLREEAEAMEGGDYEAGRREGLCFVRNHSLRDLKAIAEPEYDLAKWWQDHRSYYPVGVADRAAFLRGVKDAIQDVLDRAL